MQVSRVNTAAKPGPTYERVELDESHPYFAASRETQAALHVARAIGAPNPEKRLGLTLLTNPQDVPGLRVRVHYRPTDNAIVLATSAAPDAAIAAHPSAIAHEVGHAIMARAPGFVTAPPVSATAVLDLQTIGLVVDDFETRTVGEGLADVFGSIVARRRRVPAPWSITTDGTTLIRDAALDITSERSNAIPPLRSYLAARDAVVGGRQLSMGVFAPGTFSVRGTARQAGVHDYARVASAPFVAIERAHGWSAVEQTYAALLRRSAHTAEPTTFGALYRHLVPYLQSVFGRADDATQAVTALARYIRA